MLSKRAISDSVGQMSTSCAITFITEGEYADLKLLSEEADVWCRETFIFSELLWSYVILLCYLMEKNWITFKTTSGKRWKGEFIWALGKEPSHSLISMAVLKIQQRLMGLLISNCILILWLFLKGFPVGWHLINKFDQTLINKLEVNGCFTVIVKSKCSLIG